MVKINIDKDTMQVEEDNSLVGALIRGCKGKVTVKHPFAKGGMRKIEKVEKVAKIKDKKER